MSQVTVIFTTLFSYQLANGPTNLESFSWQVLQPNVMFVGNARSLPQVWPW